MAGHGITIPADAKWDHDDEDCDPQETEESTTSPIKKSRGRPMSADDPHSLQPGQSILIPISRKRSEHEPSHDQADDDDQRLVRPRA